MISRNSKGQFEKGSNYREWKPYWEKEFLYNLYVNEKKSTSEIASMFDVTDANIQYWLKKHGISRRSTSEIRKIKHWGSYGSNNPMYGKKGELNPNYKGGITPERQQIYSNSEWKSIAKKVRERANGKCERCGAYANRLNIHHIRPLKQGNSVICSIDDLICLCPKCHVFVHSKNNTNSELIEQAQ